MDNFRDSYFNVNWDLTTKYLSGTYWGKQYDTGRGFAITVINGGLVVTPTNEVLRLKWEKPDKTTGYVNATIVNGKFIVENIDQMFTVVGIVKADFELSVGGKFVASVTFNVNVEKAVAVDAIESSSDFTALQDALADVGDMQAQVDAVIANATVDSEVILARGTEATLGARLDSTDAQLNETANDLVEHKLDYAKQANFVLNNEINNSDFSQGTVGWWANGFSMQPINNELVTTVDKISTSVYLQRTSQKFNKGKYHISYEIYSKYANTTGIFLNADIPQGKKLIGTTYPVPNEWSLVESVVDIESEINIDVRFYHYTNPSYIIGDDIKYRNFKIINLTETFGKTITDINVIKDLYDEIGGHWGSGKTIVPQKSLFNWNYSLLQDKETAPNQFVDYNLAETGMVKQYLSDELDRVMSKVNGQEGHFKFAFMTDTHISRFRPDFYKLKLLSKIGSYGSVNFIAHGGDLVDGAGEYDEVIEDLTKSVKEIKKQSIADVLICRGNHDTAHWYFDPARELTPTRQNSITLEKWHNSACKHMEEKAIFDDNNPFGGYYYKDYNMAKIRVIVLNTTDTYFAGAEGEPLISPFTQLVQQKQLDWLSTRALNFSDKNNDKNKWAVVVLGHQPITDYLQGKLVNGILKAFVGGNNFQDSYEHESSNTTLIANCDFTEQGEMEVIMGVFGHMHYDYINTSNTGFTSSTMLNSVTGKRESNVPDGGFVYDRQEGDLSAEAIDIITINRDIRKIYFTRFGAGIDRIVDY